MWDAPPIGEGIIDSGGVRFERPISIISRCYVLLEDGSLEVWVHSGDGMSFFMGEMIKLLFAVPGVILGILVGGWIALFRRKQGRAAPPVSTIFVKDFPKLHSPRIAVLYEQ
jgi:hypothetical protein